MSPNPPQPTHIFLWNKLAKKKHYNCERMNLVEIIVLVRYSMRFVSAPLFQLQFNSQYEISTSLTDTVNPHYNMGKIIRPNIYIFSISIGHSVWNWISSVLGFSLGLSLGKGEGYIFVCLAFVYYGLTYPARTFLFLTCIGAHIYEVN